MRRVSSYHASALVEKTSNNIGEANMIPEASAEGRVILTNHRRKQEAIEQETFNALRPPYFLRLQNPAPPKRTKMCVIDGVSI